MRTLTILAILFLTGCASTTFSVTGKVKGKDGIETVKSVPVFKTQADIVAPTRVGPDGITFADTAVLGVRKIAVVDSKGNVRLDKAGNPIYNEIPVVAGIYHSTATESAYSGASFLTRSIGSLVGTIAAAFTGASAVNSLAGAIPTPQ
jgi:hypothetical protein